MSPRTAAPASELTVWLAGPAARPFFAPDAQTADDLTRWRDIVNTRKREEWEISRALLAHVRAQLSERGGATPEGTRALGVASGGEAAVGDAHGLASVGRDRVVASASDVRAAAATNISTPLGSSAREATLPPAGSPVQRVQSAAPLAPAGVALSLSHSAGFAAAAASRVAMRVGIDLECERPRDMERVARFAFAEREVAQLEALSTAAERVERFYILWTLKEAFAKALSLPLLASLRQCTFAEDEGAWRATVPTEGEWVARTFRASPALVLSVVAVLPERVSPENFRVSMHEWPAPAATPWRTLATLRSGT
jgi:phosphopantetheinyl transferase